MVDTRYFKKYVFSATNEKHFNGDKKKRKKQGKFQLARQKIK